MITSRLTPWSAKLLALLGPSLIGGVVFWYFVQQALRGHVAFTTIALVNIGVFLLVGLLCLALWLSPLLLVSYIGTWRSMRWVSAMVAPIPLMIFFPLQWWTLGAAVILAVTLGWGMAAIADDAHNRLTVRPMHSLPRGITFIIFGMLVAMSVLYYQQLRGSASTAEALSKKLIDQTVTVTERGLPLLYKSYKTGMTVDELIGAQLPTADGILKDINFESLKTNQAQQAAINDRLSQLGIDSNGVNISTKDTEATIRQELDQQINSLRQQTIDQTRQELSQRFNITIKPNETVHDVLAAIIGLQFNRYVKQYVSFVPVLLALALFFVLRFATSLLQAVVVWGAWLCLKIYRWTNVIKITQQTVPAEKAEWGT